MSLTILLVVALFRFFHTAQPAQATAHRAAAQSVSSLASSAARPAAAAAAN